MGAGSSTRKVQAEVKLREEAERRAQAEAESRKRLEEELAAAMRELLQLRADVPQAGERVRPITLRFANEALGIKPGAKA